MTPTEALAVLQQYQRWRRDDDGGDDAPSVSMPNPREIGRALDVAISTLQSITSGANPMATPKAAKKNAKRAAKAAAAKAGPAAKLGGGGGVPTRPRKPGG